MAKKKKRETGPEWNGITFAIGYNKTLAEFKKEFENTHVFLSIPKHERDAAFKEAHKIATNGNVSGTTGQGEPSK